MAAGGFSGNSRSTHGSSSVTLDELVQAVSDDVGYHWKSLTDTLGLDSRTDVQKIQHECTRQEGGTGDLQKRCANHMFAIWKSRILSSGVPESEAKKLLLFALESVPALEQVTERVRGLIGEQEDPRETTVSSDPLVESGVYSIQGSELLSAPNESSGLQVSSVNPSSEESNIPSPPQTLISSSTKPHSETSTAKTSTVSSTTSEATGIPSTESSWLTIATTGPIATSATQSTTQPTTTTFISSTSSSTATVHPSFSTSQTESTSETATSLPVQQHPTRTSQMAATIPPSQQVVNKPRRNSSENKYSSRIIAPDQVMTTLSSQSTPVGSDSNTQLQMHTRFQPNTSAGRPHSQGRGPFNAQWTPIPANGKMERSNSNHSSPPNTTQASGPTPHSGPAHTAPLPPWQQSTGNPLPTPALQRGPMPGLIQTNTQSSPIVAPYEPTTNDGFSNSRAYVSRELQRSQQTRSVDVHYQSQPPLTGNLYQTPNHQCEGQHPGDTLSIRGPNQYQPSDQNHQNHGQYRTISYNEAQADYRHHGQQRKQQLYPGLKEGHYQQEQQPQQQQQQFPGLNPGPYQHQQQHPGLQQYPGLHQGQYQQPQQQYPGSNQGQYQQQQRQQYQPQDPGLNQWQYQQQQYLGLNQGQYQQQQQHRQHQGSNQGQYQQQQQNEQQYPDYNWGRSQNEQLQQQKLHLSTNPTQVNSQLNHHLDAPGPLVTVPSSSFGIGPTRVNNYSNSYSTQSGDSGHEELPVSGVLKLTNRSSLFLILDICLRLRRRKMLGMVLKLELADIDAIIREETEPEEQTFQIIRRWINTRRSGAGATLDMLLQAMELIQETACVELIKGACIRESQHRVQNANISD